MKMTSTPFSPATQYQRLSKEDLSPSEALRIYFTLLSGVTLFVLTYYFIHLTPH
jgi:hypothetical protein